MNPVSHELRLAWPKKEIFAPKKFRARILVWAKKRFWFKNNNPFGSLLQKIFWATNYIASKKHFRRKKSF